LTDLVDTISRSQAAKAVASRLARGELVSADGGAGSSTSLLGAAIARLTERPVVLAVAHIDEAVETAGELESLGINCLHFPALEVLPGESNVSLDLFAGRLRLVELASAGELPEVLVCPVHALMQSVPGPDEVASLSRTVRKGEETGLASLIDWLAEAGYARVDAIEEPGDFALRGGILDVFAPGSEAGAVRLDFFGDEIERITEIDLETLGSGRALDDVTLVCADVEAARDRSDGANLLDLLPDRCIAVIAESMEITEQARAYYERATDVKGIEPPPAIFKRLRERFHACAEINLFSNPVLGGERIDVPCEPLPEIPAEVGDAIDMIAKLDGRVIVTCQNAGEVQRLGELLTEHDARDRVECQHAYVHRGFVWRAGLEAETPLTLIPHHELLHRYHSVRRSKRLGKTRAMDTFLEFAEGDYVVHAEHGIAVFKGLVLMDPEAGKRNAPSLPAPTIGKAKKRRQDQSREKQEEFLLLEFAQRAKLYVPAAQIDLVQRYVGGFKGAPKLSILGGKSWKTQKEKVAQSVMDLASELLRVRAARESMPGIRYAADTPWQKEFEAEFPYDETEDQLSALAAIKRDMQHERPMDRLLCGDVGFGKTELAIRAAFKAAEAGKQVAILVPTTVLAEQHERTFTERFAGYPFRIESLSRFKTGKEINQTLAALRKGHIDIVIGTHRLISKDVKFADLGLVVIDEEQRFGVEHKERLLQLRLTADILTLSATPIPRTLHMSLLGLRDISSLATPPADRQAVVTDVIPWNRKRLEQAIARELARDGQVYYVHNRVYDIKSVADEVQKLAPTARIVIGHGQMPPRELEQVMLKFIRREADILVSTTIIESGLDIPTANTMVIDDAHRYGLADLHQLRGRVGRHRHRAYCYLLLPVQTTVNETAKKRLKAIEQFSMLGAGFKIAMRDLEIRGAGNLLGAEQSGHIAAVGYEMYCRLLESAVHDLKNETRHDPSRTSVEIGLTGHIPRPYIPSEARRMEAYRRIAQARSAPELAKVEQDLSDAYGEIPDPVRRMLDLAEIRVNASQLGVRSISIRGKDVLLRCLEAEPVEVQLRESASGPASGTVKSLPPPTKSESAEEPLWEVYFRPPESYLDPISLARVLRKRLAMAGTPAIA